MGSYICHGHIIWWEIVYILHALFIYYMHCLYITCIVYILHALSVKSFLMILTRNNTNRNLAKIILDITTFAHGGDSHEWSY